MAPYLFLYGYVITVSVKWSYFFLVRQTYALVYVPYMHEQFRKVRLSSILYFHKFPYIMEVVFPSTPMKYLNLFRRKHIFFLAASDCLPKYYLQIPRENMEKNTNRTLDMTTGSAVRHIILFAIPMLIGNIFQQVYNLVDSVIVGQFVGADACIFRLNGTASPRQRKGCPLQTGSLLLVNSGYACSFHSVQGGTPYE